MRARYQNYVAHYIKFTVGGTAKQTWADWRIVPTSRPVVNPPAVDVLMEMLPGATEAIDTTEAVGNKITYGLRSGQWEFYVANKSLWVSVYSTIMNFLQGKFCRVELDDDPGYYYTGRCQVNEWQSNQENSVIVIDYVLNPFKFFVSSSEEEWLWDPFSFVDGVIRSNYQNIEVDGTETLTVQGTEMPVSPAYQVALEDSDPSLTWFQGRMYADQSDEVGVPVLYTIQHEPTMSRIKLNNSALKFAVQCYEKHAEDDYEFLGYLNSAGAIRNQESIIWLTNEVITPPQTYWLLTAMRQDGGDIATSAGSAITAKSCMTVKASNNASKYALFNGNNTVPDIVIKPGNTTLTFTGTGTVTVKYRGGSL